MAQCINFFNCDANLTLAPGYYNITVYSSNRQFIKSEFYQLRSGEYLHIFAGAFYKIILNESGLPVGTKWYVNYTYSTSNISNSIIIMLKMAIIPLTFHQQIKITDQKIIQLT